MSAPRYFLFLERWWSESRDSHQNQRHWKIVHAIGGVDAYERTGLLSKAEAARWRARLSNPDDAQIDPGTELGTDRRAAAKAFLGACLSELKPMARTPDPDATGGHAAFDAALNALDEVGVIGDARTGWWSRSWGRRAPWLPQAPSFDPNTVAIAVPLPPPENEQEANLEATRRARFEDHPEMKEVRRVIVGSPERQSDMAIVALVVHEDATVVHFHFLGPPEGPLTDAMDSLRASRRLIDSLTPPVLSDEFGTHYSPVSNRPSRTTGVGDIHDPDRRQALTGTWLYQPAAPMACSGFSVQRGNSIWALGAPKSPGAQ